MNRMFFIAVVLPIALSAQTGATVVGAGYSDPTPPLVSPGQDITFYLAGVPAVISTPIQARGAPLPLSLGGFSAQINQPGLSSPLPVPIYSVRQINLCSASQSLTSDCFLTALRVQIPFELASYPSQDRGVTEIVFRRANESSHAFALNLAPALIYLKSTCLGEAVCFTDAENHPAGEIRSGDTLTAYAYGLGLTTPAVKTGISSPKPAAVASTAFLVYFVYSGAQPIIESPLFVGLTPGEVGL